jgi:hypothetical protein
MSYNQQDGSSSAATAQKKSLKVLMNVTKRFIRRYNLITDRESGRTTDASLSEHEWTHQLSRMGKLIKETRAALKPYPSSFHSTSAVKELADAVSNAVRQPTPDSRETFIQAFQRCAIHLRSHAEAEKSSIEQAAQSSAQFIGAAAVESTVLSTQPAEEDTTESSGSSTPRARLEEASQDHMDWVTSATAMKEQLGAL